MQRIGLYMFLLLCLGLARTTQAQDDFRKTAPKSGPAPEIKLGDFEDFTLSNGLKVLLVENHKLPRVSFQLYVDVPLHSEGDSAGMADMAGALLQTGTQKRSKAEIDKAIDYIGANFSTNAQGMFGTSLTKHREKLLEIMSEVLLQPSFPQEEFEKLKKQTLSGLAANEADPNAISGNVAQVLRYGKDHPYGEITTKETVNNITLDGVRRYYQQYFKPNISYLVMVGDLNEADARKLAEKYFGQWKKGEVQKREFADPNRPEQRQVSFVARPGAVQSVVTVTYPLELKPGTKEDMRANIINTIMGGSLLSRMNANLREDKGYTYGASFTISDDQEVGYLSTSASVRNEVTDSAIYQFLYELERISTEPVSAEELSRAKTQITGSFARALENPQQIAQLALNTLRYGLERDYYQNYLQKVDASSANDLLEVARAYITPAKAHILVVGNRDVVDSLKKFTTGEIVYLDAYGNKIDMSGAGVPSDVTGEQVIDTYLQALGGRDKLQSIQDMTLKMSGNIQGMQLDMTRQTKAPNKLNLVMTMSGMTVNETKYDGQQGKVAAMGQEQPMTDEMKADLAQQAQAFPETAYRSQGYELKLNGVEQIEGKKAYVLEIKTPAGKTMTDYFDVQSGLKLRSVVSEQGMTITTDLSDYREVNGIMIPHKITTTGAAPVPISFEVKSVEFNTGIEDAVFEVE